MKIVLLAGASSIHTVRWANGLQSAGIEVHVISQHQPLDTFTKEVRLHTFPFHGTLGYFKMVPAVKRLLAIIKPDLVNAHYASGYGTTARLVGYRPWILSVWGSDVYEFPYKSILHRYLVRKNLGSADVVASTGHSMAAQTRTLNQKLSVIAITPFGVDMSSYNLVTPLDQKRNGDDPPLIIGTVKTMAPQYGIDILIKSFSLVLKKLKEDKGGAPKVKLRLVGGGAQVAELRSLAENFGVAEVTEFVGQVPHSEVPQVLNDMDIYVALSRRESFGVAVIEAGAAGRPVVVSNVGGLPEVTLDGQTGLVVQSEDPISAAEAILRLVRSPELRFKMGRDAKKYVAENYSWPACVIKMKKLYSDVIESHAGG